MCFVVMLLSILLLQSPRDNLIICHTDTVLQLSIFQHYTTSDHSFVNLLHAPGSLLLYLSHASVTFVSVVSRKDSISLVELHSDFRVSLKINVEQNRLLNGRCCCVKVSLFGGTTIQRHIRAECLHSASYVILSIFYATH